MRISDWSSDVCSSDLIAKVQGSLANARVEFDAAVRENNNKINADLSRDDDRLSKRESAAARRAEAERKRNEREVLKDFSFKSSLAGQRAGAVADSVTRLSEKTRTEDDETEVIKTQ